MTISSITVNRSNLKDVKNLYISAFPKEERLPWWLLRVLSLRGGIDLNCFYSEGQFCGFTFSATEGDIIFILFFAVREDLRAKGYGSAILEYIKSTNPAKSILLNVELLDKKADNYEQRVARMSFYRKNGFYDTMYNIDEVGGTFRVLATSPTIDREAYLRVFSMMSYGFWKPRIVKIVLETKRLWIREYEQSDFNGLKDIICDAETMKYYEKPYDENGVQSWLDWCMRSYAENGFGLWALELKETGEFIGDCGVSLQNINGEILPEIGYHINKKCWNHGYAKEAAGAVRAWFFKNTDYESVYSYMNKENKASIATAKANGMTFVGEYVDGWEELSIYSISRERYRRLYE